VADGPGGWGARFVGWGWGGVRPAAVGARKCACSSFLFFLSALLGSQIRQRLRTWEVEARASTEAESREQEEWAQSVLWSRTISDDGLKILRARAVVCFQRRWNGWISRWRLEDVPDVVLMARQERLGGGTCRRNWAYERWGGGTTLWGEVRKGDAMIYGDIKGLSKEFGSFLGYSAGKRLAFAEYASVQTFPVLKFESSRVTILPNTTSRDPISKSCISKVAKQPSTTACTLQTEID